MGSRKSKSGSGRRKLGSVSSKSNDTSTAPSKAGGTLSPYDPEYKKHLIDLRILPDGYTYPNSNAPAEPDNLSDLREALAKLRRSLTPSVFSDDKFREFRQADVDASSESDVSAKVIAFIEGTFRDAKRVARDRAFSNLRSLNNGNLAAAKPDVCYGVRPEQIDLEVRTDLDDMIIPSHQDGIPAVPNFTLEVKGPRGPPVVAMLQACHNGALGARAMQSLRSYRNPIQGRGNLTDTVMCTYQAGHLKMYTSHLLKPTQLGAHPEYAMTYVDSWSLTGNARACREGFTAYRNARDWAGKRSDEAVAQANMRVTTMAAPQAPAVAVDLDDIIEPTRNLEMKADGMSQGLARPVGLPKALPVIQRKSARLFGNTTRFGDDTAPAN